MKFVSFNFDSFLIKIEQIVYSETILVKYKCL